MSSRRVHKHLTLVTNPPPRESGFDFTALQGNLFPPQPIRVICILHMPNISDDAFSSVVRTYRPSLVFDLRTVPSFTMGRLNRSAAFALFEEHGSHYYDIPGMIGAVSRIETRLKARAMSEMIVDSVRDANPKASSIMVLLDDGAAVTYAASHLPQILPTPDREGWSVQVVGAI